MSSTTAARDEDKSPVQTVRDLVALTKPRITMTVLFTTFGGYWLACRFFGDDPFGAGAFAASSGGFASGPLLPLLVATSLLVGGANALNMYLERHSDALMERTASRPLPAGRLAPEHALSLGLLLSAVAIPWLTFGASPVTGLLGAVALVSYVALYTPMKRRSPTALLVGAVPGAIPPLLGWSAARGSVDGPGWVLFAILFFWQVPHFIAIATFRKEDYVRAGHKVLPAVYGDRVARHHVVRYTAALVMASLLLVPYGIGGDAYYVAALALGGGFFAVGAYGLRAGAGKKWARYLFLASMIYLVGIFAVLTLGRDAWMG